MKWRFQMRIVHVEQPKGKPKTFVKHHPFGDDRFKIIGPMYLTEAVAMKRELGRACYKNHTEIQQLRRDPRFAHNEI